MAAKKGTIAIEEAVLDPDGITRHAETAKFFAPGQDIREHALTKSLLDIHGERLTRMDATGVEYMLLSLTSHGPQGESDPEKAAAMATSANTWLAEQVLQNPSRFGALASLAMHNADIAAQELRRAVTELGMFGAIINDYQEAAVTAGDGKVADKKIYYDGPDFHSFWATVEELGVPVYLHPRYPAAADLEPGAKYRPERRQILGAAVQFHLDLSFHIYALCSSGIFDKYPGVQVVIGHLGEG
jgi:2,3-dihydroxybenzoate decarboxylase